MIGEREVSELCVWSDWLIFFFGFSLSFFFWLCVFEREREKEWRNSKNSVVREKKRGFGVFKKTTVSLSLSLSVWQFFIFGFSDNYQYHSTFILKWSGLDFGNWIPYILHYKRCLYCNCVYTTNLNILFSSKRLRWHARSGA